MTNDLVGFILRWHWYYKKEKVKKADIRSKIAYKFRESREYHEGMWTAEVFCSEWDKLENTGRLK